MRDIKFRAFDSENKCWRYGCIAKLTEGARRFFAIICDDDAGDLTRYYVYYESSIGQFIGVADSKCFDIYEGDIISDHVGVGVVEYNESNCAFKVSYCRENKGLGKWFTDYLPRECKSIEVIGNIYENPDLLS